MAVQTSADDIAFVVGARRSTLLILTVFGVLVAAFAGYDAGSVVGPVAFLAFSPSVHAARVHARQCQPERRRA